jgi:hypothetical protein
LALLQHHVVAEYRRQPDLGPHSRLAKRESAGGGDKTTQK